MPNEEATLDKHYNIQLNHEEAAGVVSLLAVGLFILAPKNITKMIQSPNFSPEEKAFIVKALGRIAGRKTNGEILVGFLLDEAFYDELGERMDKLNDLTTTLIKRIGENEF